MGRESVNQQTHFVEVDVSTMGQPNFDGDSVYNEQLELK